MALNRLIDVEVVSAGNVFLSDLWNERTCKVAPNGDVITVAGGLPVLRNAMFRTRLVRM